MMVSIMLKHDFYVLIVVYKQQLADTQTFQTLMLTPGDILCRMKLIVWDNSPSDFISDIPSDLKQFGDFKYIKSEKNEKLSILYNKVLDEEFCSDGFFSILDQDTCVPAGFFSEIENAKIDDKLMVPRVVSIKTNNLISPRYQTYSKILHKAKVVKILGKNDSGILNSSNFFAVGSGLTIPKKLWDTEISFEEALSFYGVDTEFCFRYSLLQDKFYLLNVDFYHDASDYNPEERPEVKKWRHRKYIEYLSYVLKSRSNIPECMVFLLVMIRVFKFNLKQFFVNLKH